MPNQGQFVRQTAAILMACGLIVGLLPGFAAAQDGSIRETLPAENGTRLRLCAEILSYALETPEYEWFMQRLETAIPEYGIGEVMIHGFRLDRWVTWSEFPKLSRELDAEQVAAYRKQLQRLKKLLQRMQADPAISQSLDEIIGRMRRARSLSDRVELDIAFHRRLVEASGLSPLLTFSDLLAAFFRRFRESVGKADWQSGIESHQRLLDALRAGQLATACKELQQHIQWHQQRMEGRSCK